LPKFHAARCGVRLAERGGMSFVIVVLLAVLTPHPHLPASALALAPPLAAALPAELDPAPPASEVVIDLDDPDGLDCVAAGRALGAGALAALAGACTVVWVTRRRGW
jgi:hypothetical protein